RIFYDAATGKLPCMACVSQSQYRGKLRALRQGVPASQSLGARTLGKNRTREDLRQRERGDRLPGSRIPESSWRGAQVLALVHWKNHLARLFQPFGFSWDARVWRLAYLAGRLVKRRLHTTADVRHQGEREHLDDRPYRAPDQLEHAGHPDCHAHPENSTGRYR